MWKELQAAMGQLPEARHKTRKLHQGGRGHDHKPAREAREQVLDPYISLVLNINIMFFRELKKCERKKLCGFHLIWMELK